MEWKPPASSASTLNVARRASTIRRMSAAQARSSSELGAAFHVHRCAVPAKAGFATKSEKTANIVKPRTRRRIIAARGYAAADAEIHALKVGGRLGRQWFPAANMVINLSGGVYYVHEISAANTKVVNISRTRETTYTVAGVVPDLKFTLGVLF